MARIPIPALRKPTPKDAAPKPARRTANARTAKKTGAEHGQMVYINRASGVVAAKLSTWPTPQDGEKLLWTIRAFDAASWALSV